jgi:putative membrane protein
LWPRLAWYLHQTKLLSNVFVTPTQRKAVGRQTGTGATNFGSASGYDSGWAGMSGSTRTTKQIVARRPRGRIYAETVQHHTAKTLLAGYIALFVWAAINPHDRATWWAENIPIVLIVLSLVLLYVRGFVFSTASYILMSVLIFLHTIGGHYTFERVPFDIVSDRFGFERNHYDRVAHFTVGFYAFAIAEALVRTRAIRSRLVLFLFPIFTIAFVAMSYELIEWWYAVLAGGDSGAAFLGSQGDVWDAQKDMLADTLGAVLATVLFFALGRAKTAD